MGVVAMVLVGLMAGLGCCGIFMSILSGLGVLCLVRLLLAGTYCAPDREAEGESDLPMHVTGGTVDEGDEPFAGRTGRAVADARRVPAFARVTITHAGSVAGAGLVRVAGVVREGGEGDERNRLQMRCGSCNYRYRAVGNGVCAGRSRGPPGFEGVL
jgi:hypothetical protein